jgi:Dehydrogenases with different specificities (related to short-chain alcohol dehydrogenases)
MMLGGRTAVVTGGSKGIGFAIAEALAKQGSHVFICARDKGELRRAVDDLSRHSHAEGEVCDVRSEDQVRMMLEECERVFGGVDILVNNAGMGIFGKTVEQISADEFRQTVETNLFGVFYACHYAIPMMKAAWRRVHHKHLVARWTKSASENGCVQRFKIWAERVYRGDDARGPSGQYKGELHLSRKR